MFYVSWGMNPDPQSSASPLPNERFPPPKLCFILKVTFWKSWHCTHLPTHTDTHIHTRSHNTICKKRETICNLQVDWRLWFWESIQSPSEAVRATIETFRIYLNHSSYSFLCFNVECVNAAGLTNQSTLHSAPPPPPPPTHLLPPALATSQLDSGY